MNLTFEAERLDEGSAEERATFGVFSVSAGNSHLTEGFDAFINATRRGPLVPSYHAAQWFVWNWWRLRWEPRSDSIGYAFAHRMTTIGEGFIWPDLTFGTDGRRTVLHSRPSRSGARPFRFTSSMSVVVPATAFEAALDAFVVQVLTRLDTEGVRDTNLHRLWRDVQGERRSAEEGRRRKLEALLGLEPSDEASDGQVDQLERQVAAVGLAAVEEIAAEGRVISAQDLEDEASALGYPVAAGDAVQIEVEAPRPAEDVPAWQIGREAALAVRRRMSSSDAMVRNDQLAQMAGVSEAMLDRAPRSQLLSFQFKRDKTSRIVLRSPIPVNRRFDLARLVGDRLIFGENVLLPATRSYTYRQKVQRAFAAELLSPSEAVSAMLDGDTTPEHQIEIADHFGVSEYVIKAFVERTRLQGEGADADVEGLAA